LEEPPSVLAFNLLYPLAMMFSSKVRVLYVYDDDDDDDDVLHIATTLDTAVYLLD
jgi:hypothetical protein